MMVTIKEYLGALFNGISNARMAADLETVEIAKAYQRDQLLKNFSVPRFKIEDVQLEIPMAIGELQNAIDTTYEPIDNSSFNTSTYQFLKEIIQEESLDRDTYVVMRGFIAEGSQELERKLKSNEKKETAVLEFCDFVARQFIRYQKTEPEGFKRMVKRLKVEVAALEQFIAERLALKVLPLIQEAETAPILDDTKVIVEASKLKGIAPENIIRISMKISEESMEWHKIENEEGESYQKLLPE